MTLLPIPAVIAFMGNDAGGRIVLTNYYGECQQGTRLAFAYNKAGQLGKGCWAYADGFVFVTWQGDIQRVYESTSFTLTEPDA